jgi:hypothetical protein
MSEVPFGYTVRNEKLVPDYAVARTVAVDIVLSHLALNETLREVDGKNGRELKGWCPFGERHGKHGSFSINKESGAFMCFACNRKGSHVLRFVELYIETHTDDTQFEGKDTQAAARWLISLVAPSHGAERERGQGEALARVLASPLLSAFDRGLLCGFMGVMRQYIEELFVRAEHPTDVSRVLCGVLEDIAERLDGGQETAS